MDWYCRSPKVTDSALLLIAIECFDAIQHSGARHPRFSWSFWIYSPVPCYSPGCTRQCANIKLMTILIAIVTTSYLFDYYFVVVGSCVPNACLCLQKVNERLIHSFDLSNYVVAGCNINLLLPPPTTATRSLVIYYPVVQLYFSYKLQAGTMWCWSARRVLHRVSSVLFAWDFHCNETKKKRNVNNDHKNGYHYQPSNGHNITWMINLRHIVCAGQT